MVIGGSLSCKIPIYDRQLAPVNRVILKMLLQNPFCRGRRQVKIVALGVSSPGSDDMASGQTACPTVRCSGEDQLALGNLAIGIT